MTLRALEFYSGIGGLHLALKESGFSANVVRAFDWDQIASQVYSANHGSNIVQKVDISTLTASQLAPLKADVWLLSPACQPYTVLNPQAKGAADPRAKSFLHLIQNVLPDLAKLDDQPKYLLVENVAGFEASSTRQILLSTLHQLDYATCELLLTPMQFGIPNSRLRYYLLAKLHPLSFSQTTEKIYRHIPGHGHDWVDTRGEETCEPVETYLDLEVDSTTAVPDRVLEKWGRLFDIVLPSNRRTCCFTRGYTQMVERCGSILQINTELDTTTTFNKFLLAQKNGDLDAVEILKSLGLRYFSPSELLRIFHFDADHFKWPPQVSTKTKYKLIGNSVNVLAVTKLIQYLLR